MYKNHDYFLSVYYRIADTISLNLAFFVGVFFRFYNDASFSFVNSNYASLLLFINVTWLFITLFQRIYVLQSFTSKYRYSLTILATILIQLLITVAFNGLIKTFYSRIFLVYTYISFSILLIIGRILINLFYDQYLKRKLKKSIIVLFGEEEVLNEVSDFFKAGLATRRSEIAQLNDKKNLLNDLSKLNEESIISELYIPLSAFNELEVEEISNFCDNNFVRLRLIFDWRKVGSRKLSATKLNQTTVIKVALTPLDDPTNALLKRTFDIVFSLLLFLLVFSWLFPIIAVLVKLSSKGPVFFIQERSGQNNNSFYCYKFRSMRLNEEADTKQATQNDPRVTKVGSFLRKSSLDELPQFINVLKGEMSVVGPRPHMLRHTQEYSALVGNFMNRHAIRPGITGLAQIKGFRGEIDDISLLQSRIRLDRFYVNNWSLFFDIQIVVKTVLTIFEDHK